MNCDKLGETIKRMRERNHLSQQNLAIYLNVDQSFISKIENSSRTLTSDMLDKLSFLFGVTLDNLCDSSTSTQPLQFSFRANELTEEDLETISSINRIALNCNFMTQLLQDDQSYE